jgi:hypothetical protein
MILFLWLPMFFETRASQIGLKSELVGQLEQNALITFYIVLWSWPPSFIVTLKLQRTSISRVHALLLETNA